MALTRWGEIAYATDQSMATITNTVSSQFRAALEALIAAVIADDPAVVAAAEAAVNNALTTVLALSKCVHFESGVPVYDGPGGPLATHYIFPDHTGELVIRPTPFPVPLATPAFTW